MNIPLIISAALAGAGAAGAGARAVVTGTGGALTSGSVLGTRFFSVMYTATSWIDTWPSLLVSYLESSSSKTFPHSSCESVPLVFESSWERTHGKQHHGGGTVDTAWEEGQGIGGAVLPGRAPQH